MDTALKPDELAQAVDDNLKNLGLDVIDVVNLRMLGQDRPTGGPIAEQFETMLKMQQQGKIRHIGLSNVTSAQLDEALQMGAVVCVQNSFGVLNRSDDALVASCADRQIAFVPYFPLGGGYKTLASAALGEVAGEVGASPHQVALAWLLHRSPNILLIPGTCKVAHLKENIAAASITLSEQQMSKLSGRAASA